MLVQEVVGAPSQLYAELKGVVMEPASFFKFLESSFCEDESLQDEIKMRLREGLKAFGVKISVNLGM